MNPAAVFYFRLSATTVAFLTVLLNGTVLVLVLFKTPKEYRNFSILYGAYSATELIAGTIGWSVIHEEGPMINNTIPVVSYGICAQIGPYFCYFMDQFTFPMVGFLIFMAPCNMAYRLYAFIFQPLSNRNVGLLLLIQSFPWYYIWYYRIGFYSPPEEVRFRLDQNTLSIGYIFYGQRHIDTWQWKFMNDIFFAPHICCVITLLFRQVLVYKIKKASSLISSRNHGLQKQFAWMLTLQGTIPLLIGIATIILFFLSVDPVAHPFLSISIYIIFVSAPILEAIVIICCLSPYRKFIFSILCKCKKHSASEVHSRLHTNSIHSFVLPTKDK